MTAGIAPVGILRCRYSFDPPYKPVNEAGACTSYMPDDFDDDCQIELAGFCKDLGEKGSK